MTEWKAWRAFPGSIFLPKLGLHLTSEMELVAMTWVVMLILVIPSLLATRRLRSVPGPLQNVLEFLVESLEGILER